MPTPNIHKLYLDLGGIQIDSENDKLTRGSDSIDQFQLITPYDPSLVIDIAFELANGRKTTYLPYRSDGETVQYTLDRNDGNGEVTETWNVFYLNIPYNILSTIALIKNATRSNIALYSIRIREQNPSFLGEYDDLATLQAQVTTPNDLDYATVGTTTQTTYEYTEFDVTWTDLGYIKTPYANSLVVSTKQLSVSPSVISSEEPISDTQYDMLKAWVSSLSDSVNTLINEYVSSTDIELQYLRRDGTNNMQDALPMNDNDLSNVKNVIFRDAINGNQIASMGYQHTDGNNYQNVFIVFPDGRRLQIGEEFVYNFRNETGTTLNSGCVLMTDGTTQGGQSVRGFLYDETSPNAKNLVGVLTVDGVTTNTRSKATYRGIVTGIASGCLYVTGTPYAEGQILYARNGKLSNVAPSKPNTITRMGAIINQNGTTYDVVVAPLLFQLFTELSDSNFTHTNGHIPMSNGSTLENYDLQSKVDGYDSDILDLQTNKANLVGGKVPASELPSYVDDVIEVDTYANLPAVGETGKVYVVKNDETSGGDPSQYRWSGSIYVQISDTLSAIDIKTLYESNANTNVFNDTYKTKLDNIEDNANYITSTKQLINNGENDGNDANKFITANDLGNAGFGDMTELEYATNGEFGVVDKAYDVSFPSYDTMNGLDDDDEVLIRDVSSGITKKTKVGTFRTLAPNTYEYGVREVVGQSASTFERVMKVNGVLYVGADTKLVANVGIDSEVVENSFDNIPIFNRQRVTITSDNGVTSQDNVMVRVPKYYIKEEFVTEDLVDYHYLWMSEKKLTGYRLPLPFLNADGSEKDYVYLSAYEGFVDNNNVLRSISGELPAHTITRNNFRTYARNNDTNDNTSAYLIQDIQDVVDLIQIPIWIEFADKDTQTAIGRGVVDLTFDATTVADGTTTTAIVSNTDGANFTVGMTIYVNSEYVTIQSIVADSPIAGQTTITFEETLSSAILTGANLDPRQWKTGYCDNVVASTGFFRANDGKHPFVWRGMENVWGNIWKFVDGIKISDLYTWVCTDFTQYNDDASDVNGDYALPFVKLNYQNALSNGYIKELGLDNSYPFAKLPIEVGAGSTTYYSDYYYQNSGDRTALLGGAWNYGSLAGVSSWYLLDSLSLALSSLSARLSYRP